LERGSAVIEAKSMIGGEAARHVDLPAAVSTPDESDMA